MYNAKNPESSSSIQLLLDMQAVAKNIDNKELLNSIECVLGQLSSDNEFRSTVDAAFNAHKYPNRSIKFVQTATYDERPERFALPDVEQKILDLMERIQKPDNGIVLVRKGDFAQALYMTSPQKRKFQDYLDHLVETGFLICIYRPSNGNNRCPGVYRINSSVTRVGRNYVKADSSRINVPKHINSFVQSLEKVILPNGTKVMGGTLLKRLPA